MQTDCGREMSALSLLGVDQQLCYTPDYFLNSLHALCENTVGNLDNSNLLM